MKKLMLMIGVFLFVQNSSIFGQLTLESCYEKAFKNYPLVQQYALVEQSEMYTIKNANKGYLPQVSISAKATYQSDVTEIPIHIPGINFEGLSKDQYQVVCEVSQIVWDGGLINSQKKLTKTSTSVDQQKIAVDMYAIKERINQLFFGIILLEEQLRLLGILDKELENNFNRITALQNNGVAQKSDLDAIRVEQLKNKQKQIEIKSTMLSYRTMLSAFIGETISETTGLIKPSVELMNTANSSVNRPELLLFSAQNDFFDSQKKLIYATSLPKLGLFFQGGYGKPGLNMLNNEASPFYIGGVKFSWSFGNYYTQGSNLSKIELNKKMVNIQRETFLFNLNLKIAQQNNEIQKIQELIKTDNQIIELRSGIKKSAEIKVENGTLAVSDLIREINAENMAMQEKILHEIQLIISIYNLKNTSNN